MRPDLMARPSVVFDRPTARAASPSVYGHGVPRFARQCDGHAVRGSDRVTRHRASRRDRGNAAALPA